MEWKEIVMWILVVLLPLLYPLIKKYVRSTPQTWDDKLIDIGKDIWEKFFGGKNK